MLSVWLGVRKWVCEPSPPLSTPSPPQTLYSQLLSSIVQLSCFRPDACPKGEGQQRKSGGRGEARTVHLLPGLVLLRRGRLPRRQQLPLVVHDVHHPRRREREPGRRNETGGPPMALKLFRRMHGAGGWERSLVIQTEIIIGLISGIKKAATLGVGS